MFVRAWVRECVQAHVRLDDQACRGVQALEWVSIHRQLLAIRQRRRRCCSGGANSKDTGPLKNCFLWIIRQDEALKIRQDFQQDFQDFSVKSKMLREALLWTGSASIFSSEGTVLVSKREGLQAPPQRLLYY